MSDLQRAIDNISEGIAVLETIQEQHAILSDGELTRLQSDRLAVAAMRKVQSIEPHLEHLFQTFAGGWYGGELREAITELWKEWDK